MKRILTMVIIALVICLVAIAQPKAPERPPTDPNAIKLPEGAKMPAKLKCPVHGLIGKNFIVIEVDGENKVYCSQCVKSFVSRVFDLNLPKLEVVK